jgi:DNA invertase Pin-like site-specific DNA recombinase
MSPEEQNPPPIPAAAYVRMSTEHQQYSTSNQLDIIKEYAQRRGFAIVEHYSDEGKSGLNIQGRDSLAQMIKDVETGNTAFEHILVYDVSRWGRFQDADESAYYEYICRRAGIAVHYCAEQFENDGSPVSTIVKGVKRAMAGEYSRELSSKVFQGASRLIQLGFKQGGPAGYGLRRALIDQAGNMKGLLARGEHKSIQTDRVILVPGPSQEVAVVQEMYALFVHENKTEREIAAILNARGVKTDLDRDWTRGTVHEVLTNEKYIGNNVYHRTSFKLKKKHVHNPPEKWIRTEGAFKPIIDHETFNAAREIILARSRRFTNEEMLDLLKACFVKYGRVSGIIINEEEDLPSSCAYRHRFGSLVRAYQLIGYTPEIDYTFLEINKRLRAEHPKIVAAAIEKIASVGATALWDKSLGMLTVNSEFRVSIVLCRRTETPTGGSRWIIRLDESRKPDITIAIRMDATNTVPHDYYILPGIDMEWTTLRTAEENGLGLDAYRFESLDQFYFLTRRTPIPEAA